MKANDPMNQEETAATLTGSAREDALHALRVLSEAAEHADDEASEIPPLPEHLRDQWQEKYGRKSPVAAPSRAGGAESWLSRLTGFFSRPRIAWVGGLAAAAAAVVLMLQQPDATGIPSGGPSPVTTRGDKPATPPPTSRTVTRIIVVAPADKAGPLLQELTRAYPGRTIERVDQGPSGLEPNTIVIDTTYGSLRRAGKPAAELIEGDPLKDPAVAITAIEALDEPEPR